ncbi:hypothetical protein ACH4L5_07610 [Streptomyces sp. NPDC017405]|uniref:hypothetical protein n=1 Tax=unclassified Streptomyces TaxID=2593676 RepID=UPI0037B4D532
MTGAWRRQFQRYACRLVRIDCGAAFTGGRWRAVERVGWGTARESRPALRGLRPQAVAEVGKAGRGGYRRQGQDQAVPGRKAGGTRLPRFRR